MEKIVEQAFLYDFYGELLNEHQREIYEAAVFNDMSLSEIAEEQGISRQGVHDILKRCTKAMEEYEEKLHLLRRFMAIKESVEQIHQKAREFDENGDASVMKEIERISNRILEEL